VYRSSLAGSCRTASADDTQLPVVAANARKLRMTVALAKPY
jgi:hypothetical protein